MTKLRTISFVAFAVSSTLHAQSSSVLSFGAKADAILRTDGAMVANSSVLTSSSGSFTSGDVGKYIQVIGAGPGGTSHSDGSMSYGYATLYSPSGTFASTDIGRGIIVLGAGPSGGNLVTTIASYQSSQSVTLNAVAGAGLSGATYYYGAMTLEGTISSVLSSTSVVLSSAASATITGATYAYGTENHAAFQAAVDAAGQAGGGTVNVPAPSSCPSGAVCGYVIKASDQMTASAPGAVKIRYSNVSLIGDSTQTNLFCRGAWANYYNSVKFAGQTAAIRGFCVSIGDVGGPNGTAGEYLSNITVSNLHLYGMTNGNTFNNSFNSTGAPLTTTGDGWDITHKAVYMYEGGTFSNVTIQAVAVQDFKGENIFSGGSVLTGVVISGCNLKNFNGDGISMLAADLQVLNNVISNGSNAGIENSTTSSGNTALIRQIYENNTISLMPEEALVVVGVDGGIASGYITIANNYFDTIAQIHPSDASSAIYISAQSGGGNIAPSNVTISSNTCHDCNVLAWLQTSGNTQVTGNTFIVDNYNASGVFYFMNPLTNVTFANNNGYSTPAAIAAGRAPYSVYMINPGYASGNFAWTNVALQNNTWTFNGVPNYTFSTTAGPAWGLVTVKNLKYSGETCNGCTYPNVNQGFVNLGATSTIEPYGPVVAVGGNYGAVTATVDASKELDGSQVKIVNTSSYPVTFYSDGNLSLASPVTLPGGSNSSVTFQYSAAAGRFLLSGTTTVAVSVSPTTATLTAGQSLQLTATVSGSTNSQVTWSVSGAGSVSSSGLYTAPSPISSAQTVTVTATSSADTTKSASATITLNPTVAVAVSPTTATLTAGQSVQLTATVSGSTNSQVTWSVSGAGSVSSSGLYTAPSTISSAQTVTVTATSSADTTKSAGATITLVPGVGVSISPATVSLTAGQTVQLTATVTGSSNQQVAWNVAGAGSVSNSGLYTAPSTISSTQTVTVTATSLADTTKLASATITLNPIVAIAVSPTTGSLAAGQTLQLTATVTGSSNQQVTWSVAGAGSVSSSGLYTAPSTISSTQTVTVTAISSADATKSASAAITLTSRTVTSSSAFSYQRSITIAHSQVANADQANFPVVIQGIYPYLANVSNGGHVQNANGYDIIFTSDSAGVQLLNWEIESYNSATGAATFWVQIPALSHTTDTVIYMSYGNAGVSSFQGNKSGTWDSSYAAVYHLSDNGANTVVSDSTANSNAGTARVNTASRTTTGEIGSALTFNGTSDFVSAGTPASLAITGTVTLEGWVSLNAWPNGGYGAYLASKGQQYFIEFSTGNSGDHGIVVGTYYGGGAFFSGTALSMPSSFAGAFHHVATTWDGAYWNLFIDGALAAQSASVQGPASSTEPFTIGAQTYSGGNPFQFLNGVADEVRVSTTARSANWISTEYNNQKSPTTFYGIGAEVGAVQSVSSVAIAVSPTTGTVTAGQSLQLTATVTGSSNQQVSWSVSGAGSVSTSGMYTAPSSITTAQTATVTATSSADTTKSASAVITLSPTVAIAVSPTTGTVTAGQSLQLTATVTGSSNQQVSWSVSGAGSVSTSGMYTAPSSITSAQTATVTATSSADTTKSASAVIALSPTVAIAVSPTTGTVTAGQSLQLTATVTGSSNQQVSWSVSGAGSVSTSGMYTAPSSITSAQTATVTATSSADTTKSASAVIALSPTVAVSVSPTTGTLTAGQSVQLTATVSGSSNQQVSWSVSPAGVGSVSAAGLYTAPATITTAQTVTVTATSAVDTTKSASASISLQVATVASCGAPSQSAWTGCYYEDTSFTTLGFTRVDPYVQFTWPSGTSLGSGVGPNNFSARWEGNYAFPYNWFYLNVSINPGDEARLYVDGNLVLDSGTQTYTPTFRAPYLMSAGVHLIRVDYVHTTGPAAINISWVTTQ